MLPYSRAGILISIVAALATLAPCQPSPEEEAHETERMELEQVEVPRTWVQVTEGTREYAYKHYLVRGRRVSAADVVTPQQYGRRPDLEEPGPALGWITEAIWVRRDDECWLFLERNVDIDHTYTGLTEEQKQEVRRGKGLLVKVGAICRVRTTASPS